MFATLRKYFVEIITKLYCREHGNFCDVKVKQKIIKNQTNILVILKFMKNIFAILI